MRLSIVIKSIAWCVALLWLVPILWIIGNAFIPTSVITHVKDLQISVLTFSNFIETLEKKSWSTALCNSLVVSTISACIIITIGLLCAFGLSRGDRSKKSLVIFLVSTRILPPAGILISLLFYFRLFNFIDTWTSLVLVNISTNLGLAVLLLSGFIDKTNGSFEDLLRVQGAQLWKTIWLTSKFKLSMVIIFCFTICFVFSWNEFLFASSFTAGGESQTLPVVASGFITGQSVLWGPMFASCALMIIPALLIIFLLNKLISKLSTNLKYL